MNLTILKGRLTKDPEVRYTQDERSMAIAKYTLAVERRGRKKIDYDSKDTSDFINCVAFDKAAEFAEKYFTQGQQVLITGRLQSGSYINKAGNKVYTTDVIVDDQEFADAKKESGKTAVSPVEASVGDEYINIGVEDAGFPFN